MIRRLWCLVFCLLLLAGCGRAPAAPQDGLLVLDDTGTVVAVPRDPERVAVLTSSLADLWIGAGGTVDITVYETVERGFVGPEVVLVDDGAGKTIELEQLVAASPSLVIYSAELAGQARCAQFLREVGIPAVGFSVKDLKGYLYALDICTDILGTRERYEEQAQRLGTPVSMMMAKAWERQEDVRILFVRAGSDARYTKAKTAEQHFACDMLDHIGTHNIAEDAPILLDGLSIEHILVEDPQVIFFTTMGDEQAGQVYMDSLMADPVWQELTAVRTGAVYHLPKDLFQYKPNSRWDEAYAYLIRCVYGELTYEW